MATRLLAAATLFPGVGDAPLALGPFAAGTLPRLASFGLLTTGPALSTLTGLGSGLARILFSTTLARLPSFTRLTRLARAFALLSRLSAAGGLSDFALELFRERIEFRLGKAQLFRVITQHAFGGAFDAAAQFLNSLFRALAGLPGLRQIAFPQHVAGEIEGLSTRIALGGSLKAIVQVAG